MNCDYSSSKVLKHTNAGMMLCMVSAKERRRYNVTSSLIGWAHTQYDPCNVEPL